MAGEVALIGRIACIVYGAHDYVNAKIGWYIRRRRSKGVVSNHPNKRMYDAILNPSMTSLHNEKHCKIK